MTKLNPKGFILWRGNSPIDGEPIVAIMTLESSNRKTGNMAQVYILHADKLPTIALADGSDHSICGDCPHRRKWNPAEAKYTRSCYVNVGQSVNSVFRAFKRGSYVDVSETMPLDVWRWFERKYLNRFKIRWGAYGDPAMIPLRVVRHWNNCATAHTGYTHQWKFSWAAPFKGIFQASCDSFADYMQASSAGWKTFAVVPKGDAPFSGKLCPATAENSQAQCATCKLCDGAKTDIFVVAHGVGANHIRPVREPVAA